MSLLAEPVAQNDNQPSPKFTLYRLDDGDTFIVREPFYLASCDYCGWVGSSEECSTSAGYDDADVHCPRCHQAGADCGEVGENAAVIGTVDPPPAAVRGFV